MAMTQLVVQGNGPLPISQTFTPLSTAPATIFLSATAWSTQGNATIGVSVLIDGKPIGSAVAFTNEGTTHATLVSPMLSCQFPDFNAHKITVVADAGTTTDQNDVCSVTIVY